VVVLQKGPSMLLVALFVRGFWLEVTTDDAGRTKARYVMGEKLIAPVVVGRA
jgi:hypothetical protein